MADAASGHAAAGDFGFVSTLAEGTQRFLARAIAHGLARGRRSPADFLRHFPPSVLMKGLEHNAELRAFILASTTGIKEKIALKKSWEDAAADLELALEEGETDAEAIVQLFAADDCTRYVDARKIWQFLTEGEFWNAATSDEAAARVAREHVAYLLQSALDEELIDQRDIVEAITVSELANRLPREQLGVLLRCALEGGKNRRTFTAVDLLASTGPRVLVHHVPLPHIWNALVRPRIARRHGYEASQESSARSTPENPTPPRSNGAFLAPDEPDEVTRVMPGQDLFDVEETDGFMVPIEDTAKAM
ncbi:MAG TPA: hypothetical protein VHC69_02225 [Polyangiaceae bacterium]|nr:hypothetical protein [Polyangiaceae bacterium]